MAGELSSFLSQWCSKRGLPQPEREADGRAFLVFDGQYEIAFSQVGQSILLETVLGPVPEKRETAETLLESLMRLQLARAGDGEPALALDEAGHLTVTDQVEAGALDQMRFEARLGAFVNAAAAMTALMASDAAAPARPIPAPMMATQFLYP